MPPDFLYLSLQVKDQLPHLKAIVQYKDELRQKLPNLYTVCLQCKPHDEADKLHKFPSRDDWCYSMACIP